MQVTSRFGPHKPRVACFLMDGMWSHDVASVIQVFGGTLAMDGEDPCDLIFVADGERARLDHGISVETVPLASFSGIADLVCVPGFVNPLVIDERLERASAALETMHPVTGTTAPVGHLTEDAVAWLSFQRASGAEFASLGTGAFALAAAGMLTGARCTTHWVFADDLARLFPKIHVDADRILVHDEYVRVRSCAGGASGVDLCLAALIDIAGHAAARSVSNAMNLWRPRSLDARQDAFGMADTPDVDRVGEDIEQLKDAVHRHLGHSWSVSEMAWYVGMSVRTFQRRFQDVMAESPAHWIMGERLAVAAQLLEETELPLPLVAGRVGLTSADQLRRRFHEFYGETPAAYRKRLRARGMPGAHAAVGADGTPRF